MKSIKVLQIGNSPDVKGGITSVISQITAHNWEKEGISMKLIPTYIETNSIGKILYFAKAYRRIRKEFKTNRPDVVHIHMSYKGSFKRKYAVHKLCVKNGINDIIHLHGSEFKKWYDSSDEKLKSQIRQLLREAKRFIVLGEVWKKTIDEIEPRAKTVVASNTVAIPNETTSYALPFKFLFSGVLIKRKGVSELLEAVKILDNRNELNNVEFVIAGTGEQENMLRQKARELKIDKYVSFVGWVDGEKKKSLLKSCQALVLPSYNEGLPIAILEAISYGLPVVSTNVGDIPSAVIDEENGFLVNPGDVEALADALIRMKKEDYNKMSEKSRTLAEQKFSDESYFEMLKKLYESVV